MATLSLSVLWADLQVFIVRRAEHPLIWTITGAYRSGEDVKATLVIPRVSRADLAEFMLRQLCSDTHVRRTPAIMY